MGFFDLEKRKNACSKTDKEYEEYLIADNIKQDFTSNPAYVEVWKNLIVNDKYDTFIIEETKVKDTVGEKTLISYPYTTPVFTIGDYISFLDAKGETTHWVIESLDTLKYYDTKGRITKTNNYFAFVDEFGNEYSYPCIVKEKLVLSGFSDDRYMDTPEGRFEITLQLNSDTIKIKEDTRSLMNNLNFQDESNGIQAFKVTNYVNMSEPNFLKLYAVKDQINELTDDLDNLMADKFKTEYAIEIQEADFEQQIGYSTTLNAIVTKSNIIVDGANIIWESSDDLVGTVNQNGDIDLISTGQVVFTSKFQSNTEVSDTITIDVVAVPSGVIEVRIEPSVNDLLQGESQIYTVYKYIDGIQQVDTFTISVTSSDVPVDNYNFSIISGNSFSVANIEYYTDPLVINCVSDVDASSENISINLKGLW